MWLTGWITKQKWSGPDRVFLYSLFRSDILSVFWCGRSPLLFWGSHNTLAWKCFLLTPSISGQWLKPLPTAYLSAVKLWEDIALNTIRSYSLEMGLNVFSFCLSCCLEIVDCLSLAQVEYKSEGFLEKNRDTVYDVLIEILKNSKVCKHHNFVTWYLCICCFRVFMKKIQRVLFPVLFVLERGRRSV